MYKKLILTAFTILAIGLSLNAQNVTKITDPVSNEGWKNDANEVFQRAEQNGSPILLNFTGSDWCIYCMKIKQEIFDTPEFKNWANENNIELLELDFPKRKKQSDELVNQNKALAAEIGVQGFPTIIVVANGKAIKAGYVPGGPTNWINYVESQIEF